MIGSRAVFLESWFWLFLVFVSPFLSFFAFFSSVSAFVLFYVYTFFLPPVFSLVSFHSPLLSLIHSHSHSHSLCSSSSSTILLLLLWPIVPALPDQRHQAAKLTMMSCTASAETTQTKASWSKWASYILCDVYCRIIIFYCLTLSTFYLFPRVFLWFSSVSFCFFLFVFLVSVWAVSVLAARRLYWY